MKRFAAVIILFVFLFILTAAFGSAGASEAEDRIFAKSSTGSMVVRIQLRLRELGYLNFKPTGSYKSMTVDAVKAFQTNYRDAGYDMQVDGRMGSQSMELLFKYEAMRSSLGGISIPSGPKHGSSNLEKTGDAVPWSSVKDLLKLNTEYSLIDCYTGAQFSLVYVGGENHADMEPASEAELERFKAICGREYNYLKRPVVIVIDGREIAASVQCWPHGVDSIGGNGMEGHVCLFFEGSLSNVGGLPDVEHNETVRKASGQ